MVEIIRYDCAESIEEFLSWEPFFGRLKEAKIYSEPGWKNFKITIKIEEIEE